MDGGMPSPKVLVRSDLRLPARPESAAAARRAIEALDMPDTLIADAKLLVSELVTNSVRHAGLGPEDYIQVTIRWSGSRLRVIVWDRTTDLALSPVVGQFRPAPGTDSGWGLFLVDRIAGRWGTSLDRRAGYWFELELDGPAASPEGRAPRPPGPASPRAFRRP
jgi:anti-sigma regulatory factor (Ser/Thr protein kinase)